MRCEYLLVLTFSALIPVLLGGHPRVRLYQRWKAVLPAIAGPTLLFWLWDIAAVRRGHWNFNEEFILGWRWAGLPLEEYLFFIVVGFVSLFTYEAVKASWGKGR
jgi:lycopene cyclase domain-containing protein